METDQRHLLTVSLLVSPSVELGLEGTTSSFLVFCLKLCEESQLFLTLYKVRIKPVNIEERKDKKEGLTGARDIHV